MGNMGDTPQPAKRFSDFAEKKADENDRLIGDRLTGTALHFLGDQPGARSHLERMLASYVAPVQRSHAARFQFHQRVSARMTLARVLWLQGFPDQALGCAKANIEDAVTINHTLSLCNALANAACPLALLVGDLAAAEHYTNSCPCVTASTSWPTCIGRLSPGVILCQSPHRSIRGRFRGLARQ